MFCKSSEGYLIPLNFCDEHSKTVKIKIGDSTINDIWQPSSVRKSPDQGIWKDLFSTLKGSHTVIKDKEMYYVNEEPVSNAFLTNLIKIYFSLVSVFTFGGSAALKDSQTSIPNGIIGGIVYTAVVCNLAVIIKCLITNF